MAKQQKTKRQKYSDISSTHPVLCPDGKYRWVYDVPMLKNPSILLEVFWVLGISFGILKFCLFHVVLFLFIIRLQR